MRGGSDTHRRRLLDELKGLFGPAFGPALEAYGRSFAERISEDEGFRAEIRDRFERGRAWGGFPELSSHLAGMSLEEEDEFFASGWTSVALPPPGPPKNPWDRPPWAGDREAYREGLYSGLAFDFTDLRAFAREWLEELLRVGYYGMEESLGLPIKQQAGNLSPVPESLPLYGESYPVRLEGTRQTVWLGLDGPRSEKGQYREVTISEEPLRTDGAIFAALSMLEGQPIDLSLLREALPDLLPSYRESVWDRWTELPRDGRQAELLGSLRHHGTLDYILLLLRYHRPGFDALPLEERAALLVDSCSHLNDSLETSKKFMAFVEHGVPGRRATLASKSITRDIKAAILKDVESLTYKEIGDRLGIPLPANFSYKGDHAAVRKMVDRGRRLFRTGLGDEGYASHVASMKEEARRRRNMSEMERESEDLAEAFGIPYEEALEQIEKERKLTHQKAKKSGPD